MERSTADTKKEVLSGHFVLSSHVSHSRQSVSHVQVNCSNIPKCNALKATAAARIDQVSIAIITVGRAQS